MDSTLFVQLNGAHSPFRDDLMLLASALGKAGFIWLTVAAIAAVFPARRMAAWRLALAIGVTFLLVDGILKPVVHNERPFDVLDNVRLIDQRPTSGSFPSGHAASAFAGALAASRLFPAARIAWWLLAGTIAVSRVYVGAHWPSDVIAGALIGLAAAWFALGGRRVDPWRLPTPASPDASRA